MADSVNRAAMTAIEKNMADAKLKEVMIGGQDVLTKFAVRTLVSAIDCHLDRFYTEGPQEPGSMDRAKHEVLAYVRILIAGERT